MTISDALFDAYWSTTFEAHVEGHPVPLHIGENCPELNRLLKREAKETWAFVTACNPRSKQVSDASNRHAQAYLHQAVADRWRFYNGIGHPQCGSDWPAEPSLLILGIDRDDATRLGRRFDQLAVLVGRVGAGPELVFCGGESRVGLPRLLYRELGESLVFVTEERALQIAQIHWALTSSRTWDDFRRRMPPRDLSELMERWRDSDETLIEEGVFDGAAAPGYCEGDYPAWLQQEMEDTLPDVAAHGEMTSSALNGPMVHISTANREAVLADLEEVGYDVEEAPELTFN